MEPGANQDTRAVERESAGVVEAGDPGIRSQERPHPRREEQAGGLSARVEALTLELAAAREALTGAERRREIDLALVESEAIDLETARLLTEAAVTAMEEPDVRLAVTDLRRRKPFLFRRERAYRGAPAMRARTEDDGGAGLEEAAEAAMANGDRASLLAYLRMRRAGR